MSYCRSAILQFFIKTCQHLLPTVPPSPSRTPGASLCFHLRCLSNWVFLSACDLSPNRTPFVPFHRPIYSISASFNSFLAPRASMLHSAKNFARYLIHLLSGKKAKWERDAIGCRFPASPSVYRCEGWASLAGTVFAAGTAFWDADLVPHPKERASYVFSRSVRVGKMLKSFL